MIMTVIAIDFDDTALIHPSRVNQLFDNPDNFIVIYTARPEYLRDKTVKQLQESEIMYHFLVVFN